MPSPLLESVDTVTSTIGGCAALGTAFMCAREAMRDEPRWDQAIGWGTVAGALFGAVLLAVEIGSNV
jgi:hypothetical protein